MSKVGSVTILTQTEPFAMDRNDTPAPANPMAITLTDAQLADYHDQGYVLAESVFPQAELDRINADLDRILDARGETTESREGWLLALGQQSELTAKICEDDRLLDLIAPLVQPGIAIYSSKLANKAPFDETVCHWHQDEAYYVKNSQSDCRLSVYVALQDITPEMGCLQVIPGSHKRGLRDAQRKDNGKCALALTEPPDLSRAIYVPMKAGDVLIFSALLHHGSDGNPTPHRRRAFIISYQEATAGRGNGEQFKVLRPAE